jgi:hypothetical protein
MKRIFILSSLALAGMATFAVHSPAVTVQTAGNVFDAKPFLYVEAESASTITGTAGTTWKVASKGAADTFVGSGATVNATGSNASGGVIWAPANDFSSHIPTAQYQLQFITAGTYQLFLRQSLSDNNANGSLLNEDSIFLPPGFNKNSGSDWVGFASQQFDENDLAVDIPTPGYPLDPDGYKPQLGDFDRDGLLELQNWGYKDNGVVTLPTPSSTVGVNGNYAWYNRPTYQGVLPPSGGFDGFFGLKAELTVTPDMVGQTVTFELGMREINVAIDGFLFINTGTPADIYPLEGSAPPARDILDTHTQAQLDAGVLPQPVEGDYNGNGKVDAADYALWRNGGPLMNEVDVPGTVNNADYTEWRARFGNPGPGSGSGAGVPEPTAMALALTAAVAISVRRRRAQYRPATV